MYNSAQRRQATRTVEFDDFANDIGPATSVLPSETPARFLGWLTSLFCPGLMESEDRSLNTRPTCFLSLSQKSNHP